mmetsp:Transcript_6901/g.42112  ORF Transcript_6901/g.42112 Transcript_6901/m.42112 type:complete len:175 (-) Transcript_6901:1642-2166(-)
MHLARVEGSSIATPRRVPEECEKRLVERSVDACKRVGRARLLEVETRTTMGNMRTRDVPLDAPHACGMPPLRAGGRGVACWTCRMDVPLVRVPRTWTMIRTRRTDGFQLAGTHPTKGTKDGGKRLRRRGGGGRARWSSTGATATWKELCRGIDTHVNCHVAEDASITRCCDAVT